MNIQKKLSIKYIVFGSFLVLAIGYSIYHTYMYKIHAQTCFTREQVAADSRCLMIYKDQVFEKGTRAKQHSAESTGKCGTDVTAIIPSFHYMDAAKYLDPNYRGNICTAVPTSTPTPTSAPTVTPSSSCQLKNQGDANCSGVVDIVDFEIWRKENFSFCSADHLENCQLDDDHNGNPMDANFNFSGSGQINVDTKVDTADFEIWRKKVMG